MKTSIKYIKEEPTNFSTVLKKRVANYFNESKTSRHANWQMVLKTVFMFSLFFVPMTLVVCMNLQVWTVFVFYMIAGLGKAGLGMGVMHDANHGSYSSNRRVNQLLGYTMNFIGGNAHMWKFQHNVLHHTYTNIHDVDEDIVAPIYLRFSPHTKRRKSHKFQHIYAWLLYGLSTLPWATSKDFVAFHKYSKMGLIKSKKQKRIIFLNIIVWKLIYFLIVIVLPVLFTSIPIGIILLAFLCQHYITGLTLTLIFQLAHVVPETEHPLPNNDGVINEDWAIHQITTTSNFAPKSKILSWFIGGLNYQIEHHLFPNICHIHYKKLSPIVRKTAAEYGITYSSSPTFLSALRGHFLMLKRLGRVD